MTATIAPTTSTLAGFMGGRTWIGHAQEAKTFTGAVPRDEALRLLSYPLAEGTVTTQIVTPDGVLVINDPTRKTVVRVDTEQVFGIFKQGYQIHQPAEWCLRNVDLLLDGGLEIGTVALTKGGIRALLQAELPEDRVATAPRAEPVRHRPHITAATSHDGSIATTYGIGTRVLICENELSVGGIHGLVNGFSSVHKIRHTSQSLNNVLGIRESLGLVVEQVGDVFEQEFQQLVGEYVSDSKWNEFVKAYTGIEKTKEGRGRTIAQNKVGVLNQLWTSDERAASWRNSAYGVLAAVNTAAHHAFGPDKNRTERNQDRTITGEWASTDAATLKLLASV